MKRISRYKPVGWRGEPHRHYLAAKGIKTNHFFSRRRKDVRPGRDKKTKERSREITTDDPEKRMTEMFVQNLTKAQKDRLDFVRSEIERLQETSKALRDEKTGIDVDEALKRLESNDKRLDIAESIYLKKKLKKRSREIKRKLELKDTPAEMRGVLNQELRAINNKLKEIDAQKFKVGDEFKTIGELSSDIGEIEDRITELKDEQDLLEGKIPEGASKPRAQDKARVSGYREDQLVKLASVQDLADAYPDIVDESMGISESRNAVLNEVERPEIATLAKLLNERGKLPRKGREKLTLIGGKDDKGRAGLADRLGKEQELAAESDRKDSERKDSERIEDGIGVTRIKEMKSEAEFGEFENVPGSRPRFKRTVKSRDRASEGKEARAERKAKADQEAAQKELEKERKRKEKEGDEEGENMAMKSYYSKKTDRNVKKVRKEFGPMERLVAAPVLRSIKSIEQVNESKYGGFRAKEK